MDAIAVDIAGYDSSRTKAALSASGDDLLLTIAVTRGIMQWNTGSGAWDTVSANWVAVTADIAGATEFQNHDAVLLSGVGATLTIRNEGVTVAKQYYDDGVTENPGVDIAGGAWTIQGGALRGGGIRVAGDSTLTLAGVGDTGVRAMEQAITVANGAAFTLVAHSGEKAIFNGNDRAGTSAIYGGTGSTITLGGGGTLEFSGNTSTIHGGAIYAGGDMVVSGGINVFSGNSAGGYGGAAYVGGNAALIASDGDVVFRGNREIGNRPNALYLNNSGGGKTLDLAAKAGRRVEFHDPIRSSEFIPNLTIGINRADADPDNPGVFYTGTVLFDMSAYDAAAHKASEIHGDTTVYRGTMALAGGAVYGAAENNASFTLDTGATLSADAKANAVRATAITLAVGSLLSFDLTGAVDQSETDATTNLTLTGDNVAFAVNRVTIASFDGSGTYALISGADSYGNVNAINLALPGMEAVRNVTGNLFDDGNRLLVTLDAANGILRWNGGASGMWDTASDNWTPETNNIMGAAKFVNGDAVLLAGTGATLAIQEEGVTVAKREYDGGIAVNPGVEIRGGAWTIEGGALRGGGILISDDSALILAGTGNSGVRAMEQAISVADDTTFTLVAQAGETAVFDGFSGRAISGGSGSTITLGAAGGTGTLEFTGNTSANDGGAIRASNNMSIYGGGNEFTDNRAGGSGGAAYIHGNAALVASGGDILFRKNVEFAGSAAARPNALYLDNHDNDKTLHLAATDGRSVQFSDPIRSSASNSHLAVAINRADADPNTAVASYAGTVVFDMSGHNTAAHRISEVYGNTTVHGGTLAFKGGAIYGAEAGNASFTLNAGATLAADAAGNGIRADTITIQSASTLRLDMTGAVAIGKPDASRNLTLSGTVVLDGVTATDRFTLDLLGFTALDGAYDLVAADTGVDFTDLYDVTYSRGNDRTGDVRVLTRDGGNEIYAVVEGSDDNRALAWNGTVDAAVWNTGDRNWLDAGGNAIQFLPGDRVVFGVGAEAMDVVLTGSMQVADMTVDGGVYTFRNGGSFSGVGIASTHSTTLSDATHRLTITGADTEADFFTNLSFTGGLEVADGARMGLGAGNTFTAGSDGDIRIGDGSTLALYGVLTANTFSMASLEARDIGIGDAFLKPVVDVSGYAFTGQEVTETVIAASGTLDISSLVELAGETVFYSYRFTRVGNDLELTLGAKSWNFADFATSPTSMNMALALDEARANGVEIDGKLYNALLRIYGSEDKVEAGRRLLELSGPSLAGGRSLSPLAARLVQQGMGRLHRYSRELDRKRNEGRGDGDGYMSLRWPDRNAWRFWAEGAGSYNKATSGSSDPGYEAMLWGGTVAGFRGLGEFTLGAALSASRAKLDWDGGYGKTTGNSFAGTLFASYERDGWFANLDGGWGTTDVKSRRHLPLIGYNASADYRTHWYGADLGLGRRIDFCEWTLIPEAGARWYRFASPSVREKGAGNAGLSMRRGHQTSLEVFANLEVTRRFLLSNGVTLRPRLMGGVAVETSDRQAKATMSFQGAPGIPAYTGYGPKRGRVSGLVEAGMVVDINRHLSVYGEYQGEFTGRFQRHTGRIGVGVAF